MSHAIRLSDHFNYRTLIRFSLPSIVMMLFTSIYGVVDGLFISNIVGETAFAAINLIMPYCMIFSAVGSLFGVGGSALVALVKGQGDNAKANRIFSMLVYSMIAISLVLTLVAQLGLVPVAELMGAEGELESYAVSYGRIFLLSLPAFLMQYAFQTFLITAEQPKLGLVFTLAAGISNMILDYLFIAVFRWGVEGAAAATCIGQCIGGFGPLLYFIFSKDSSLKLGAAEFRPAWLLKAASNGAADFITNVAMSAVNIVYNYQLLRYIGEYGVSAYGIIMYVNFVFVSVYLGYTMGVSPIISYHYGAENPQELKTLFHQSMVLIVSASLVLTLLAELTAPLVASIFAGYDEEFLSLSTKALRYYSLSYVFAGVNIFASGLFAALNDGFTSGLLSGLRILVFQLGALLLLPLILGADGIWLAMLAAEFCVFVVSVLVLRSKRPVYQY